MAQDTQWIDQMHEALALQQAACASLGSGLYADLLAGLSDDYAAGGPTRTILKDRFQRPVHDAVPLRLLGGVHALALSGATPATARHFPSCGGTPGPSLLSDVLDSIDEHTAFLERALSEQVQTNEVGRSVVHLALSHWIGSRGHTMYDHFEVGASAGLNMNFDRFFADTGHGTMGHADSTVRFSPEWFRTPPPTTLSPARVRTRRGCDISPIDVNDDAQALRLLSFVWPDQPERFVRTRAAIEIARQYPPVIDVQSADAWIEGQLGTAHNVPTLVFHSIVWQYLGTDVQRGVRNALHAQGARATSAAPLWWARMEPAGAVANVTVTQWSGGEPSEWIVCEVGYHGQHMRWLV